MSYIANSAFEARVTNNERDELCNIAGKYYVSTTATDCSAGLLCVQNGRLGNEGFDNPTGTRVYNDNAWIMNMATDAANIDTPVYACNTYDTQLVTSADGNNWFVGSRTLGLGVPAGRYGNFTIINFDGRSQYRFGIGNVSNTLSTNTYFTIDNGQLKAQASAPTTAGSIYFELLGTGYFTEGTSQSFKYVDVIAKRVSVAAG